MPDNTLDYAKDASGPPGSACPEPEESPSPDTVPVSARQEKTPAATRTFPNDLDVVLGCRNTGE